MRTYRGLFTPAAGVPAREPPPPLSRRIIARSPDYRLPLASEQRVEVAAVGQHRRHREDDDELVDGDEAGVRELLRAPLAVVGGEQCIEQRQHGAHEHRRPHRVQLQRRPADVEKRK